MSTTPDHREILRLAVPAFFALVAEPIFLLIDSAIIGHLGIAPLAGLGIASNILLTAAGVLIFLAYGTTAIVARRLGAGDRRGAISAGIDGIWLGIILGVAAAAIVGLGARWFVDAFGPTPAVAEQATTYLHISAFGLPGMVVVLAATGLLRGLQDTRTPMVVAITGFAANAALSYLLVYPAGLGIAGAAWGTVIAQTGMALTLVIVAIRAARTHHASLRFTPGGVLHAARGGIPLLIRTLALRATLILTTWVATAQGDVNLAAHQLAMVLWTALSFMLDALAIAAQALVGKSLGAGDTAATHRLTATLVRWGLLYGALVGVALFAIRFFLPQLFTSDEAVAATLVAALVVVAVGQPVSGVAFVLDGVLIGAGDARWLAWAQVVFFVLYIPMALAVHWAAPAGPTGLVWLWVAFSAFMLVRALGLWWRSRSSAWLVTGSDAA